MMKEGEDNKPRFVKRCVSSVSGVSLKQVKQMKQVKRMKQAKHRMGDFADACAKSYLVAALFSGIYNSSPSW